MPEDKKVTPRRHPGRGAKRTRRTPKGRQVDSASREEIRALVGGEALIRSRLIEYLHLIQDAHRQIAARHLAALADLMRLSMAEVYEVATFYAHFDVVDDTATAPEVTIRVCESLSCWMQGAQSLSSDLADLTAQGTARFRIVGAPCMGRCDQAPVAEVGHRHIDQATAQSVLLAADARDVHPKIPSYPDIDAYCATGGYEQLARCQAGETTPDGLIERLNEAGLRGLGGAGFPTGRKWSIVRSYPGPRLMAVNADEGEPGTFKDRHYMETAPHQFIEGLLIAAWAVDAQKVYLYLRDEYPALHEVLTKELDAAKARGFSRHTEVELRRGAGAYICGEESAMLESIEGKRGLPRHRPPYVAEEGLFGQPTLVQNVETLFWLPTIFSQEPTWFAEQGRHGGKGLRSYSVSGRIRDPGVKLAPAGVTVRELIDEYCGGMLEGQTFKGYLPGGASGGILPASMGDLPLEFGSLEKHGCFVGSHAVVVLSDQDNMADVALNLMRFFEDESCGQCTPCRVGTEKAVVLMERPQWDHALLRELGQTMADASICGLGQAAANPLLRVLEHFPADIEARAATPRSRS
ncbi:MAG: NADH:ubiquinone oxidoreductase subunit F (NADH-binding)/NADH:ubiquinone oxidoreductase subunit E [Gammaproteobacteria bacterium]|jgi:NADH:ubiquinone oxidoreductase subunit F (NADH-binding)/NADH:ubiquinone oxidoreductase subunit E